MKPLTPDRLLALVREGAAMLQEVLLGPETPDVSDVAPDPPQAPQSATEPPVREQVTSRGFPAPIGGMQELQHSHERVYVIRLTDHERSFLHIGAGIEGKFALMYSEDGTYSLVRVSPSRLRPPG